MLLRWFLWNEVQAAGSSSCSAQTLESTPGNRRA